MSWLLAVLMTLCASQAVPVVRASSSSDACAIVWIARQRARTEQRVLIDPAGRDSRRRATAPASIVPQAGSRLATHSLYQRPPPSLS